MADYDPKVAFGLAQYSNLAYCRKGALKNHFKDPTSTSSSLREQQHGSTRRAFMITHAEGVILAFVPFQLFDHDLGQSYLPQLSAASGGHSSFD